MMIPGGRILWVVGALVALAACRPERAANQAGVETVQLTSTFLERAEYDAAARTLTLHFDDASVYRYADVPPEVFAGFRAADVSPGSHFNASIRDSYEFTRLTPPRPRTSSPPSPPPTVAARRPEIPCPASEAMRREEVVSVAFDALSYDPATRCLVLYFDSGHVYRYGGVPAEVSRRLRQPGPDPVAYFNASVRNAYRAQRLR